MAYFRTLPRLEDMLALFSREERWLIAINADPDALASAMALKRIMARRVLDVGIAHVNTISRPDNLQMIQSLHIPTSPLNKKKAKQYDRFALVDSQPHHHKGFKGLEFSLVIDHHPVHPDYPVDAPYVDIVTEYGANATRLTEYLYNLAIRPGKLLATALQYGIKTDTSSFERAFDEMDLRAFQYLNKFSSTQLLRTIYRSEFHMSWLRYFCEAYFKLRIMGQGLFAFLDKVESADILVILADLFLRVQGSSWTVISGIVEGRVILIFRGDGLRRSMESFAIRCFDSIGSAGGHRNAARAEFDLQEIGDQSVESFLWKQLQKNIRPSSGQKDQVV